MVGVHVSSARDARDQVADDFPLAQINLTLKFRHLGVKLSFQLRLGFYFTTGLLFTCKTRPPSQSYSSLPTPRAARDPPRRARAYLSKHLRIRLFTHRTVRRNLALCLFNSLSQSRCFLCERNARIEHTLVSPQARASAHATPASVPHPRRNRARTFPRRAHDGLRLLLRGHEFLNPIARRIHRPRSASVVVVQSSSSSSSSSDEICRLVSPISSSPVKMFLCFYLYVQGDIALVVIGHREGLHTSAANLGSK